MSNRLMKDLPFYIKKTKYPQDDIYKKCKQCVNYVKGKCILFEKKINVARDFYCRGWYFKVSN